MAAILLHLGLTLLPGFLLATLTGVRRHQLLFSVTFSCAILVSGVSLARNHHVDADALLRGYLALTLGLSALLAWPARRLLVLQWAAIRAAWKDRAWLAGLTVVTLGYLAWYAWTGPYTEIPADLYRHLEFTRIQLEYIQQGSLGPPLDLWQIMTQHGGFWYVLVALDAHVSGVTLDSLLAPLMGVNGLLFVLAVYLFSHRLFGGFKLMDSERAMAASLSAFFVVAQMGVSVFSFVRYYSLAPAMLNFIVFFAAQACLLDLLEDRRTGVAGLRFTDHTLSHGLLWLISFLVALVMHNQEGLFVLLMAMATVAWLLVEKLLFVDGRFLPRRLTWLIGIGVLLSVLALVGLRLAFAVAPEPGDALGKVVALPFTVPGYGNLFILKPGYQFVQTVTLWGGIVTLLFLLRFQWFRRQPWLVAGMLLPVVTVFNPVFVDLYLRVEGGHSLWRLCFLMPLYAVAALWIVNAVRRKDVAMTPWRYPTWLTGMVLIVLVLPIPGMEKIHPGVRHTNLPVNRENSWHQWRDLVDALNELPGSENILTDPVTGYVISALTPHKTFRYKFFANELYEAFPFTFKSYDNHPLSRYRGWLLVVNLRDGARSDAGRRSGHWPGEILRVSSYYPGNLRSYLATNGDRFERIWGSNDVTILRILY